MCNAQYWPYQSSHNVYSDLLKMLNSEMSGGSASSHHFTLDLGFYSQNSKEIHLLIAKSISIS